MTKTEKEQVNQLADALIADALQQEDVTALYHSLERFYKGMRALECYVYVKEASGATK